VLSNKQDQRLSVK